MAVRILQFIAGGIPNPAFLFKPTAHASKSKLFLAAAVLLFVWSLIRLLSSRRGR